MFIWEMGWDKQRYGKIFIPPLEAVYIRSGTGLIMWQDDFYPAFKEKIKLDNSQLENQNKKISPFTKFAW